MADNPLETLRSSIAETIGKSNLPTITKNAIRSRLFTDEGDRLLHGSTAAARRYQLDYPDTTPMFAPPKVTEPPVQRQSHVAEATPKSEVVHAATYTKQVAVDKSFTSYERQLIDRFLVTLGARALLNNESAYFTVKNIAEFYGWVQDYGKENLHKGVRSLIGKNNTGKWVDYMLDPTKQNHFGPVNLLAKHLGFTKPINTSHTPTTYVVENHKSNIDRAVELYAYAKGETPWIPAKKPESSDT